MPKVSLLVLGSITGLLSLSNSATAADANWVSAKILESGPASSCGGSKFSDYRMEIKGDVFTSVPVDGDSRAASATTLNIKSLKPDGAGRITRKDSAGKTWNFDFEAGSGPRKVRYGNENAACRYVWAPK